MCLERGEGRGQMAWVEAWRRSRGQLTWAVQALSWAVQAKFTVVNLPGSVFFIPLKGLCVVHDMLQREGRTSVHCCRKARPASAVFQESLIMNDFASTEL